MDTACCVSCKGDITRHAYCVVNGIPYGERFCTLRCTEQFIEERFPGYVMSGMQSMIPEHPSETAHHTVHIKFSTELKLYDDRMKDPAPHAA
jgi:hypothetical protein